MFTSDIFSFFTDQVMPFDVSYNINWKDVQIFSQY